MRKPNSLIFYTNMPTPYQIDFFDALKEFFQLTVIYYTDREKDRIWNLPVTHDSYKVIVLKDSFIAKIFQKKVPSFHFSWQILPVSLRSDAEFVIINGTYWSFNVLLALLINRIRRKKVFYWSEPLFPVSNKVSYFLKYLMLFPVRQFSDALFAIGKNAMENFRYYGYKKKMYNIPYNIDIALFDRQRSNHSEKRNLVNSLSKGDDVYILTSGSLTMRKGVDTLIKAFLQIPETVKAKLLILGDGPDKESLKELAAPAGGRIIFLGFVEKNDIPYYFANSDIFAFASRYDGWALVINEALAADLPIISSDKVGAAVDKLKHRINALICPAGDINAFYKAMHELVINEDFRKSLVTNAQHLKIEISSAYNAEKVYGLCNDSK